MYSNIDKNKSLSPFNNKNCFLFCHNVFIANDQLIYYVKTLLLYVYTKTNLKIQYINNFR